MLGSEHTQTQTILVTVQLTFFTLTLFRTVGLLFGRASHKVDDLAGHKYPVVFRRSVSARLNNLSTVTEQTGAA